MSYEIKLNTYSDNRGKLTVIDKELPFDVKRVYYIYNTTDIKRGGHRHKKTIQALICIKGSCEIYVDNSKDKMNYVLDNPDECLILNPEDWHTMQNFSEDCILLVLSSEKYDINDYIDEPYDTV